MNKIKIEEEISDLEFNLTYVKFKTKQRNFLEIKLWSLHQQINLLEHNYGFLQIVVIKNLIDVNTHEEKPTVLHFNLN